jgi:hypothetical protein
MVCSIDDYNAKRGFRLWGRDTTDTDEEWFGYLRAEASTLLVAWRERRERSHLVRYEDLIGEPRSTLAAVFSYLGLDASADAVRRILDEVTRTSSDRAQAFHRTSTSVEASIGRWKHELSPAQKALCAKAFDDILLEFGYEPTGAASTASRSG